MADDIRQQINELDNVEGMREVALRLLDMVTEFDNMIDDIKDKASVFKFKSKSYQRVGSELIDTIEFMAGQFDKVNINATTMDSYQNMIAAARTALDL